MAGIQTHVWRVTGVTSILFNNPRSMEESNLDDKKVKSTQQQFDYAREAEIRTYRCNGDGSQLYIPTEAFLASMIRPGGGAKYRKIGKHSASGIISGAVFIIEPMCRLVKPENNEPIYNYTINLKRVVVNKKSGIIRARPEVWPWACDLALDIDTDLIDVNIITEVLNFAGRIAGVGDYRPQRGGPHGKYNVELKV